MDKKTKKQTDKYSSSFELYNNYFRLIKPRITTLCLFMAAIGYVIASDFSSLSKFISCLIGVLLSVSSANVFNMVFERQSDALMLRTKTRPLASGRVSPGGALVFALVLMVLSLFIFWFFVNPLSTLIAFLAIASYSFLYTPLKKYTPLSLFIGASPGSAPLLLGLVCMSGEVDLKSILFTTLLFIWQMPHFIALAILYKEDYKKAHIKVVSLVRGETFSLVQSSLWSFLLIVNFVFLFLFDYVSLWSFILSSILSLIFFAYGLFGFVSSSLKDWAFVHFKLSLYYLPCVMLILALDSLIGPFSFFWMGA